MIHSSMLTVTANVEHLTYGGYFIGKIVHFGNMEFIVDCFSSLSFSPKGNDSGTVFVGTSCSGSPPLRTILDDSTDMFYIASSG
jgi:hypothetical protein